MDLIFFLRSMSDVFFVLWVPGILMRALESPVGSGFASDLDGMSAAPPRFVCTIIMVIISYQFERRFYKLLIIIDKDYLVANFPPLNCDNN